MAALIGLCLKIKLKRELPRIFRVLVYISPGSHVQEIEVNKQVNDKDRVSAALTNKYLLSAVEECLKGVDKEEGKFDSLFRV